MKLLDKMKLLKDGGYDTSRLVPRKPLPEGLEGTRSAFPCSGCSTPLLDPTKPSQALPDVDTNILWVRGYCPSCQMWMNSALHVKGDEE